MKRTNKNRKQDIYKVKQNDRAKVSSVFVKHKVSDSLLTAGVTRRSVGWGFFDRSKQDCLLSDVGR